MDKFKEVLKEAKQLFKTLNGDISRCDLFRLSSGMAYTTILSLVPSIAVLFYLGFLWVQIQGDQAELMDKLQGFILSNLATGSGESVVKYIEQFMSNIDPAKIGVTGLATLLVTLIMLLRQIELAFNKIWEVKIPRGFWTRFVNFWVFITLGGLGGTIALGIAAKISLSMGDSEIVSSGLVFFKFLVSISGNFILFFCLYKIVPNCYVKAKDAMIGAITAGILLYLASYIYGNYNTKFLSYKNVYGSMAAFPFFLMWIYVCWIVTFIGAVVAWRSSQGFEIKDRTRAAANIERYTDVEYAQALLRGHMPFVTLVAIYDGYDKGAGEKLTAENIARRLHLPREIIEPGLHTLKAMHYVHTSMLEPKKKLFQNKKAVAMDTDEIYLPAVPKESVKLDRLNKELAIPSPIIIEGLFAKVEPDIKAVLDKSANHLYQSTLPDTLLSVWKLSA